MVWFFLLSGLFLGWSLGANDAGNIYGTAISTKMVRFTTAAILTSVFVFLGSMLGGYGTTHTLGMLGDVNAIAGSFTVALSAAITVYVLIRREMIVSVSQAIIGAIIGWNIFTSSATDISILFQIVTSWVLNPLLAGIFSFIIYLLLLKFVNNSKIHILRVDYYLKFFTLLIISFGAYSLGANNIANVVGVFITSSPFKDLHLFGSFQISALQQLFLVGVASIILGIATYSKRTTETIGKRIYRLTPISSLASISAASLVLFLFSSTTIDKLLNSIGIPSFPLVPVSITQAIVGSVIGIGIAKGGRYINYKILGKIGLGWVITPLAAGVLCFVLLFIVQNVFHKDVYNPVKFEINSEILKQMKSKEIKINDGMEIDSTFENQQEFRSFLTKSEYSNETDIYKIFNISKIEYFRVDSNYAKEKMSPNTFSNEQIESVKKLHGYSFKHRWQFIEKLKELSEDWRELPNRPENEYINKQRNQKLDTVSEYFILK